MTASSDSRDAALRERRVLILGPTSRDATLIRAVLCDAGIQVETCPTLSELCAAAEAGAGALLLGEESLVDEECLAALLLRQPSWSDLPVLVLTARGADSARVGHALATLGNVTLLERPTRVGALVSTVRSALRARERQYQIRGHLAEHERNTDALRELSRRKDEFLAMLAHELRNPLAPIRNSLFLLRDTADDPLAIATIRARMERQVEIIVRLVDDLLEVSRITRGLIELRLETVDLCEALDSAVETSRPAIDEAGHELLLDVPPGPLRVEGDPVRLAQIFSNLLNNAAKYTDRGGRIVVSARREGDQARVVVRDNGIGIPEEMLTRVFEMFTQTEVARHRTPGGLGIGLTLVRRLVEMHGGDVEACSAGPGRGSEFIVRLPLPAPAQAAAPAPRRAGGAERVDLSALRVLVVDDNRDAADSLGMLLRLTGAQVRVANDGPAALDTLADYRPDVALLDIGMPGMSGYELATRMRARPEGRHTTLVALTGWGQEDDRRRSHAAGFQHHLIKPVAPKMLKELLASLAAAQEAEG